MSSLSTSKDIHDAIVVGAGPAGIAASIQLAREGIPRLLIERAEPGGLLRNANLVENYPGFPEGIEGPALVRALVRQLARVGLAVCGGEVRSVDREGEGFAVEVADRDAAAGGPTGDAVAGGREAPRDSGPRGGAAEACDGEVNGGESIVRLRARTVIVATGTRGIIPDDIPIPLSLLGSHIYREIADVTPGTSARSAPTAALIGGGDCAFDYALNLLGRGCRVTILHRGQRPRALPVLVDRVARSGAAEYRPGVTVGDIERVGRGLRLHLKGGNGSVLEVDFLMLAVGREPEDGILAPGLRAALDAGERIDGLHLAGDVRRGDMRQVGIAVGDGLVAAMETARLLKGRQ